jgi:DNA-binding MarR family transcriptional regulator
MIPAELRRKPGHLIRRAQQIAVAHFVKECRGLDLTPLQYGLLKVLKGRPGTDQATLAGLLALDRSTLADVAARLEDRGLIVRGSGADRRVKLVSLTPAGSIVLGGAETAVDRAQERILHRLEPEERKQLVQLLEKLVVAEEAST